MHPDNRIESHYHKRTANRTAHRKYALSSAQCGNNTEMTLNEILAGKAYPIGMTKEEFMAVLNRASYAGREAVKGMEDTYPCGGAYLTADGRSDIVRLFKKHGEKAGKNEYTIGRWRMWKSSRGFIISNGENGGYQNMQMHSAENNAYVTVFGTYNLPVSVHTYID